MSVDPTQPTPAHIDPRAATVLTHRRTAETGPALGTLFALARAEGVTLRFSPQETEKHSLVASDGIVVNAPVDKHVDLCIALGGDGTILSALRKYAGTGVPVFGINFGEIGFLSAVDRERATEGIEHALMPAEEPARQHHRQGLVVRGAGGERPRQVEQADVARAAFPLAAAGLDPGPAGEADMGQDVIDPHAGHEGAFADEAQARGAGTAQDRIAEVLDMRPSAELREIFLPDREGPERRHGLAPGRRLMKTWPLILEPEN